MMGYNYDNKTYYGLMYNMEIDEEEPDFYGCRPRRISLTHSSVNVTVRGFIAHLVMDLKYINTCGKPVEVTYTCPVDAKSAIFEFTAELNGRTIRAHCTEKKKAEEIYKTAVKKGQSAIFASEARESADVMQLSLGNLDKDETALLHLEMVMELPVGTDGSVTFNLPIVFNPRYSSNCEFGSPNPVVATSEAKTMKICSTDIKAKVAGWLKIDRIVSSSSTFDTTLSEDSSEAELTHLIMNEDGKDWSFQVYYHSPHQPHILKETGDRSSSGMMADDVIMLNIFPEMPAHAFNPHNEIIFVVDCSGSMQGDKIGKAKTTLLLFLKSLPHGCRFNIICFGCDFKELFAKSGSERYTEETLKKAIAFQQKMDADLGGTEILSPLKHIYSQPPTAGYARQILLLTDGEVWNVNEIVSLVARNSGDTRFFSVGIGHGASTALVQGLAQAGNGRHEMVNESSQLQLKVMGLIASMLQNNVTDVNVDIELDPPSKVVLFPNVPPIIFGGQHLILYARAPAKSAVKHAKITGKIGDKTVCYEVKENDCKQIHDTKLSIHRIAAKKQISDWQIKNIGNSEEIVELSTLSGVVSRLTALVGLDQDGKNYRQDPPAEESDCHQYDYCMKMTSPMSCMSRSRPQMMSRSQPRDIKLSMLVPRSITAGEAEEEEEYEDDEDDCGLGDTGIVRQVGWVSSVQESGPGTRMQMMDDFEYANAEESHHDVLLDAIVKQNFDGSWDIETCSEILKISVEQMKQLEVVKNEFNLDDTSFATAICLAWFQVNQLERKQEWDFISMKGCQFLKSKGLDDSKIIEKCDSLLNSPKNDEK